MGTDDVIERLKRMYGCYYDVKVMDQGDLRFTAEFHSTGERYILIKSATLWTENDNEYVYVFSGEILDENKAEESLERSRTLSEDLIEPNGGHRTSDITTVFIYRSITESAERLIRRYRYHRSYMLSICGWTDHRVAALETDTGNTYHNRLGKKLCDNLRPKANK